MREIDLADAYDCIHPALPALNLQLRFQPNDSTYDDRAYAMNLALIRHAADLTQVELARRLGVGQAAVSKVERQHDLLLSTLSSYVAAAGAHARIVVTVGDRDLEFDLAALPTRS